MAIQVLRNSTATAVFLNLQSGLARPYWEVNITVSGDATTTSATLGQAYAQNDIINIGMIDRARPIEISGLGNIFAGDVTITLNNGSGTYSDRATGSIFTDAQGSARDFMHSTINIWAGFEDVSGTAYTIQRGSFLLTKLRIDSERRLAYFDCQDAAKLPLQDFLGLDDVSGTARVYNPTSGIATKAIMSDILSGLGLSASQYDLASGLDFPSFAVQNKKASDALSELAQANNGYIFTNGKGQIVFRLNSPTFGGINAQPGELTLGSADRIIKSKKSCKGSFAAS